MTLEIHRAPLPYYIKLCASFQSHGWIQTVVTVRKCSIQVKIGNFWSPVTLQFDRWPWKTIGHLFYATLSFVHHFVTIGEFKLELQSRNVQFGHFVIFFTLFCEFVYHNECLDELTKNGWCHTINIMQVYRWGYVLVQVICYILMT